MTRSQACREAQVCLSKRGGKTWSLEMRVRLHCARAGEPQGPQLAQDRPDGRSNMQVTVMRPEINDGHTGPGRVPLPPHAVVDSNGSSSSRRIGFSTATTAVAARSAPATPPAAAATEARESDWLAYMRASSSFAACRTSTEGLGGATPPPWMYSAIVPNAAMPLSRTTNISTPPGVAKNSLGVMAWQSCSSISPAPACQSLNFIAVTPIFLNSTGTPLGRKLTLRKPGSG